MTIQGWSLCTAPPSTPLVETENILPDDPLDSPNTYHDHGDRFIGRRMGLPVQLGTSGVHGVPGIDEDLAHQLLGSHGGEAVLQSPPLDLRQGGPV